MRIELSFTRDGAGARNLGGSLVVQLGAALIAALAAASCTTTTDPPSATVVVAAAATTAGNAAPVPFLKGGGTPPNFVVGSPFPEIAAAAAPPSPSCPLGRIILNAGGSGSITSRPIYKPDGTIDTSPSPPLIAFPIVPSSVAGQDPNLVRLTDGTFLAESHGGFWGAFPGTPPAWQGEYVNGIQNARWDANLARADACGGNWQASAPFDLFAIDSGKYSVPRPAGGIDANGIPSAADVGCFYQESFNGHRVWWVGGGDRPEVYACPFTRNVYMAFWGVSGPYCSSRDDKTEPYAFGLVVVSHDKGQTWQKLAEIEPSPPIVMTSTPDGRLFVFDITGGEAHLFYTTPTAPGATPVFVSPPTACGLDACPFVVNQLDASGTPIPVAYGDGADLHDTEPQPRISRISTDHASSKVRLIYPTRNASGMQQARVVRVEVPPEGGAPLVKPIAVLDAADPQDHSVTFFDFNDPDVPSAPPGGLANTSMAYWLEAPRCRAGEVSSGRFCADFNHDSTNCGGTGACAAGQVCAAGACVAACPSGTTQCSAVTSGGQGCFDTKTSTRNCGSCGNLCDFGQQCVAGACVAGTGKPAYSMRHAFFDGDCRVTRPRALSVDANGAPRTWEGTGLNLGDYEKGASFWNGTQLNYFAHWSDFSVLNGAVTTSPFAASSADAYAWTHDRTQSDFTAWDGLVRGDGWKMVDLRSFLSPAGAILVDGVWQRQSAATNWIEGYTYADYLTALDNLKAQGYRLEKLQSFTISDGTARVDAFFQQNADVNNAFAIQGFTVADFVTEAAARASAGDRLDHLGSWVLSDGSVRVDAVWHHDPGQSYFVQGYTPEDFVTANNQRTSAGWRLDEVASFYLPGQGVRVDGLWHVASDQSAFAQGYTVDDFRSLESDLRCQGFQLQKVSSFVIPDAGIRMDGVWHRPATPPPTALCQDVTVQAGPGCTGTVTADMVDNGSFDGTPTGPTLTLSSTGPFPLGPTGVTLTATSGGLSSTCTATVTVTDATPPAITAPPPVNTTQCLSKASVTVGTPTVSDNCGKPTVTGTIISVNGVPVSNPPFTGNQVSVGIGTTVIQWSASDGGNSASATQTVTVGPRMESGQSFLVDDRAKVIVAAGGALAAASNAGSGQIKLGSQAQTGGLFSVGPINVPGQATIGGDVISAAAANVSKAASVSGTVVSFGSVSLPALPTLPSFPPVTGGGLTWNTGTTSRGPGSYDTFTLNGGTLSLTSAGDYYFRTLTINAGATVRVAANAHIYVQNSLTYQSRFLAPSGTATQSVSLGFAGTSLSMLAAFNGTLVAPSASVSFGTGSGLTFTGSFFAQSIEIQPASVLACQ
jgi:hypothetical protein